MHMSERSKFAPSVGAGCKGNFEDPVAVAVAGLKVHQRHQRGVGLVDSMKESATTPGGETGEGRRERGDGTPKREEI